MHQLRTQKYISGCVLHQLGENIYKNQSVATSNPIPFSLQAPLFHAHFGHVFLKQGAEMMGLGVLHSAHFQSTNEHNLNDR